MRGKTFKIISGAALTLLAAALITAAAFFAGCGEEDGVSGGSKSDINGGLVGHTGTCKDYSDSANDFPLSSECARFEFDGLTLAIDHINAGFNCCPGEILSSVEISGRTILIEEDESEGLCDCLCLFDTYYEIEGLEPDVYTVIFTGPYLDDEDELLTLEADLSGPASGSGCADRSHYPWHAESPSENEATDPGTKSIPNRQH